MKPLRVSITDCSYDILKRVAERSGFVIHQGGKHCKVKTQDGRFVTNILRHSRMKRETARGIIDSMNEHGANITYN